MACQIRKKKKLKAVFVIGIGISSSFRWKPMLIHQLNLILELVFLSYCLCERPYCKRNKDNML